MADRKIAGVEGAVRAGLQALLQRAGPEVVHEVERPRSELHGRTVPAVAAVARAGGQSHRTNGDERSGELKKPPCGDWVSKWHRVTSGQ
jgi:hypothetical protein